MTSQLCLRALQLWLSTLCSFRIWSLCSKRSVESRYNLSLVGDVAAQLNGTLMEKVAGKKAVNQGTAEYKKIGHMLPETKKILDDFYQPFITRLAEMLNDKRFLWLDKEH